MLKTKYIDKCTACSEQKYLSVEFQQKERNKPRSNLIERLSNENMETGNFKIKKIFLNSKVYNTSISRFSAKCSLRQFLKVDGILLHVFKITGRLL